MHNPVRQMLTSVGQMHTPKFRTNAYSSRTNAYNKIRTNAYSSRTNAYSKVSDKCILQSDKCIQQIRTNAYSKISDKCILEIRTNACAPSKKGQYFNIFGFCRLKRGEELVGFKLPSLRVLAEVHSNKSGSFN